MYGGYKESRPSTPPYAPQPRQAGASGNSQMNSYPPQPGAAEDAAANALAGLSIDTERHSGYDSRQGSGTGPPSSYPPYSEHTSGPYPSQGLPYLASPIGGVVTGPPYAPTPAYNHPGGFSKSKAEADSPSSAQPYGLPSTPYPDSYPATAPSASALNLPENLDTKSHLESRTSQYGIPPGLTGGYPSAVQPAGYPPSSNYPPSSSQQDPSTLHSGYLPHQAAENCAPIAVYSSQQINLQGESKSESTVSPPTQASAEGTMEKGFKHGQHGQQHGYGYPQPGHVQHGYAQPGYPPEPYAFGRFSPNYPPAYPAHGYLPQGYPIQQGYGVPGYLQPFAHPGHGHPDHVPAPYGAFQGHGVSHAAPYYGGHYKQHKGGHKKYKHEKLKGHKGHSHHYQEAYGHYGGQYSGHQGGHHGEYYGGHEH